MFCVSVGTIETIGRANLKKYRLDQKSLLLSPIGKARLVVQI